MPISSRQLLKWYLEAGVDEAIGEEALDRFAVPPPAAPAPAETPAEASKAAVSAPAPAAPAAALASPTLPPKKPDGALHDACSLAEAAGTLDELRRTLEDFAGCGLRKTATNLVFGDGDKDAAIIFIGEAPGAEEDRQGLPFVGPSGRLLERMIGSIGLERSSVFISNTVFWRPPGNRSPTTAEMAVCMPFVERLIELVDPQVLVALGGPAAKTLLARSEGVGRLRGRWFTYSTPRLARPVDATATFHPAYLLRSPAQKREVWSDMLAIKRKLDSL